MPSDSSTQELPLETTVFATLPKQNFDVDSTELLGGRAFYSKHSPPTRYLVALKDSADSLAYLCETPRKFRPHFADLENGSLDFPTIELLQVEMAKGHLFVRHIAVDRNLRSVVVTACDVLHFRIVQLRV